LPIAFPASALEPPYPIFVSTSTTNDSKKSGEHFFIVERISETSTLTI
jgi:hypothetical protein